MQGKGEKESVCVISEESPTKRFFSNQVQFSQWRDLGMCVLIHLESKPLAYDLKENLIAAHKQLITSQTLPEKKHEDASRAALCLNTCGGIEYITDEAIMN